ncbi:rCG40624 [Rattus norvegicus]|uniref:RCG40624 n=1 Tax=Rattus norvegicus TaxID=10116 RepID=A6I8R7_RAT|nr:rCG40624 [Rattus norvegicus]
MALTSALHTQARKHTQTPLKDFYQITRPTTLTIAGDRSVPLPRGWGEGSTWITKCEFCSFFCNLVIIKCFGFWF